MKCPPIAVCDTSFHKERTERTILPSLLRMVLVSIEADIWDRQTRGELKGEGSKRSKLRDGHREFRFIMTHTNASQRIVGLPLPLPLRQFLSRITEKVGIHELVLGRKTSEIEEVSKYR